MPGMCISGQRDEPCLSDHIMYFMSDMHITGRPVFPDLWVPGTLRLPALLWLPLWEERIACLLLLLCMLGFACSEQRRVGTAH